MFPVSLVFFCSGFAALIYELLWLRELGLIFGNTVQAAAAVMTAYMLGLALGARIAGRWAERLQRPVKTFGLLEAAIGVYALLLPFLFALLRLVYKFAYQSISDDLGFLTFVRFVFGLLVLLLPTALMGATLPVLSKGLLGRRETFGAHLGMLYGMNTFGAAAGILFCGFVFIPVFGLATTNAIAIGINFTVCIVALILSRFLDQGRAAEPNEAGENSSRCSLLPVADSRWLMTGIFLSGAFALALEVIWFRTLILVFGSTTYSFATMLAVFLLGIALGSALLSWIADRVRQPAFVFISAQILIGLYTLWSMRLFNLMPEMLLTHLAAHTFSWKSMLIAKSVISMIFLLPVSILFGVSFTAVARAVRNTRGSSSATVGDVYTINTIGAAIGSCVAGFVLLPRLGITTSLLFVCACIFVMVVVLSLKSWCRVWLRGVVAVLALCGITTILIRPPVWDPQVLSAGPYFNPSSSIEDGKLVFRKKLNAERLILFKEGTTSLVSVTRSLDENLYFSTNGKVEADSTPKSMALQRMMGHLPMLFHPGARKALNIGLGAGVTFGALSCYPLEHLEVVDIEPAVQEVVRVLGDLNHRVLDDPRAIVTINDGRNHLFATSETYDVITSDPFEPVMAGAANLYTVEHFEQARSRLSAGGIMCQYLPLYELSREDFAMIVRSFIHIFPESVLFFTGDDTIMLGFEDVVNLNMGHVREKFAIEAVYASLVEFGFAAPESILGMFVADLRSNPAFTVEGTLNTDRFPRIEYSAPRSALQRTVDLNQQVLIDLYSEIPAEAFHGMTEDEVAEARLGQQALRTALEANLHRSRGNYKMNIEGLMAAAKLSPRNAIIRNDLISSLETSARSYEKAGNLPQAAIQYQLVLDYDPLSFTSLSKMVHYAMQGNQIAKAREYLNRGLQTYPNSPIFIYLRSKYKATIGDIEGALADIEAALEQLPGYTDFWDAYQLILNLAGRTEAAGEASARAEALRRGEV